ENSGCVIAEQAKEMLGYCLFELKGSEMTVLHINPKDDIPLADGILRSTIHAGLEKGAVSFKYSKTAPEKLFKLLGFIKNSSDKTLDENKLFESCCKH
ncbi:MAG: hypothetical protein II802_01375, partial [Clostridia bacterium]|nr:hypothetical protein [Clostridia bacterium]